MKVLLYTEGLKTVGNSGLGKAIKHQMQALESEGIEYTLDPKEDWDILHINTWWLKSYFMAKKAKRMGKKVVYHAHSTEEDYRNGFIFANQTSKLIKWWLVKCYSLGDVIVTPTPYSKKLLEHYKGLENKKIYAISNGIDLSLFKKDKKAGEKFRKEYGYTKDDKVVIGIGLYIERKGIVDFVKLAKKFPEYKFIWFGSSPLSVATKPVKDAVNTKLPNLTFAGHVEQEMIKAALNGCDLYLFPTLEETEGIPIIEACAVGANALIRDIKIFDGWLKDGKNVYKAKDLEEFEIKTRKILTGKLPSVSENAYEVAKERDIKEVGKQLKKVYEKVMKDDKEQIKYKQEQTFKLKKWSLIFTSILLLCALIFCKDKFELAKNEYNRVIDGYNVKIYTQTKKKADKAFDDLEQIIDQYNNYNKKDGEIAFINNNNDDADTLVVSSDLYKMLVNIDDYSQSFGDNLDIYLGKYYSLWNEARKSNILPNINIEEKITPIKFLGNNKIVNNHPNIYLDTIYTGYIINEMQNYLNKHNIDTYLISKNSIVATGKNIKEKDKYLIAIASPFKNDDNVLQIVKITNKALSTKGIYQNNFEIDGKNYSNIISPETYAPAENAISVTVLAPNALEADMVATYLFLTDIETGLEYVNSNDKLDAVWCYYKEDNSYDCVRSENFDNNI